MRGHKLNWWLYLLTFIFNGRPHLGIKDLITLFLPVSQECNPRQPTHSRAIKDLVIGTFWCHPNLQHGSYFWTWNWLKPDLKWTLTIGMEYHFRPFLIHSRPFLIHFRPMSIHFRPILGNGSGSKRKIQKIISKSKSLNSKKV